LELIFNYERQFFKGTYSMPNSLLVTGASGQLGQRVLHHLLDTLKVNPSRIIAATRKPQALNAVAARGVSVRAADFDDIDSLKTVLTGVQRVLLISTDALDLNGRRLAQHRAAVAASEQAGVQHLIYTSMPNADTASALFAPDHAGTEAAMASSSLPGWTVLRNHWYFENLFMSLPAVFANEGQWFHATGQGKAAMISRDDLARAAATVLASGESGKNTYTLSGGQALSTEEQATLIGQALSKSIKAINLPEEGLQQGMIGAGMPATFAKVMASFDTNTERGYVGLVTADYQRITGVAPQAFSDWLVANRDQLLRL
jgi:NAD(P)H dehydrogenase (quinone)